MDIKELTKLSVKVEVDQTQVDECLVKLKEMEIICDKMNNKQECNHFLDIEIERSKEALNKDGNCYDGVKVGFDERDKLLQSHIRFCEQIKNILKVGD